MKKKLTLRVLFAFTAICLSLSLTAATSGTSTPDNDVIKLNYTMAYNTEVVQVSFNANDGLNGFLQVLNKDGVVMRQLDQVELIKSPNYFTMDVSEFPAGDYTFVIKTAAKTYTSTVTIK